LLHLIPKCRRPRAPSVGPSASVFQSPGLMTALHHSGAWADAKSGKKLKPARQKMSRIASKLYCRPGRQFDQVTSQGRHAASSRHPRRALHPPTRTIGNDQSIPTCDGIDSRHHGPVRHGPAMSSACPEDRPGHLFQHVPRQMARTRRAITRRASVRQTPRRLLVSRPARPRPTRHTDRAPPRRHVRQLLRQPSQRPV
jgi:hypothetical protein